VHALAAILAESSRGSLRTERLAAVLALVLVRLAKVLVERSGERMGSTARHAELLTDLLHVDEATEVDDLEVEDLVGIKYRRAGRRSAL
jgi:hypothetical protein